MRYSDGSEVRVGDQVSLEHGRTPGVVVDVITLERLNEIGVGEPGAMIETAPLGLIYIPTSMFVGQGLGFVARAKPTLLWSGP